MEPRDADFEERARGSFARQTFMATIGARLTHVAPGETEIELERRDDLLQQHGHFHAGVTTSIADSAAGYAALTLFEAGHGVLTTELKINLLRPAGGERLVAKGRVIKPGRTLTISQANVYALARGTPDTHVATGLFTMMQLPGIDD